MIVMTADGVMMAAAAAAVVVAAAMAMTPDDRWRAAAVVEGTAMRRMPGTILSQAAISSYRRQQ